MPTREDILNLAHIKPPNWYHLDDLEQLYNQSTNSIHHQNHSLESLNAEFKKFCELVENSCHHTKCSIVNEDS